MEDLLKVQAEPQNGIFNLLPESLDVIKETEVKTYSHRAKDFNIEKCLFTERPEFTNPLRALGKDSNILELAAGEAKHSLNLLKDGFNVAISDIAPGAVQKVKAFTQQLNINSKANFFVIDAENLPFNDESFDGIFIIAALHHLQDVKQALAEIHRSLKPGGCFLIGYEPASWQYYLFFPITRTLRFLLRKKNKNRPTSLADDIAKGFSRRKLKKLLKEVGFKRVEVTPVHYTYKTYKNYRILVSKFTKKKYKESELMKKIFLKIDQYIAQIPLLKDLAWDFDAKAYK